MKLKNRNIYVFDNGGETSDRYTIVIGSSGDLLAANNYPFHPGGFGQHAGNLVDNRMSITFGYGWRNRCNVKNCIKREVERFVNEAKDTPSWLGKEITNPSALPADVVAFIAQNL